MKDIIIGFLGKTLNMPTESVAELLFKKSDDGKLTDELADDVLNVLLQKDADRVETLRKSVDTKEVFDNGYKKAQKEVSDKWEKLIKDLAKVETEKQGEDLLKEAFARIQNTKLEDDKIKLHPLYLDLESKKKAELDAKIQEYDAKIQEIQQGYAREKTIQSIRQIADQTLDALKPDWSKFGNDTIAKTHRSDFLNMIASKNFETVDGKHYLMQDDKRVEDAHGNAITVERFVQQEASNRFVFLQQDPKGNAGNKGGGGGGSVIKLPSSQEEYNKQYLEIADPTERMKFKTAWDESRAGQN